MKALAVALSMALVTVTLATLLPDTDAAAQPPVKFGMDASAIDPQTQAGIKPDYATFWIGPWTLKSGWNGPDAQLTKMADAGVTPAIHFYYWGDDISVNCIENGCYSSLHGAQKTKAGWQTLAQQLVDHLKMKMGDKPVIIFLETEFNKGNVATYEPLDGYLAEKALFIKQHYPQAKIVMALGNWNSPAWATFDRTAAASEYIGIQGMRGSTRNSLSNYMGLYEATLDGAKKANAMFQKPVFIQDIALSTYPEPEYLSHQDAVLKKFFTGMAELKASGVEALIYRSWRDSPNMDLANYYGQAERHWGFAWASNGTVKPAGHTWVSGVKAERAGATTAPPPPAPAPAIRVADAPVATEAENFATKTTGGRQVDSQASESAAWNIWANGHIQQRYDIAAGNYELVVRAKGTPLGGVGPNMVVTLGGTQLLVATPGVTYADYKVSVAGAQVADLRIAFTNDARTASEDRNLIVDRVSFGPANRAPNAAFTSASSGLSVSVDGSSSSDPDGDPLTYAWSFGDGSGGAQGVRVEHTYAAAGTYTVSLTVSDGKASAVRTSSVTVTMPNRAPSASFAMDTDGLVVLLDASASSDPDGDPLAYAWTFGDGASSTTMRPRHEYANPGSYDVTLTVSDGKASASASKRLSVARPAFQPTFAVSPNVNAWWVEVSVSPSKDVAKVEASVNGGKWTELPKTSWGAYAKSMSAPKGSSVVFRATDIHGQEATSETFRWMGPAFEATFKPKTQTNRYWIETVVTASAPLSKVEARAGGGAWFALDATQWDSWAKGVKLQPGTLVEFRATSTQGDVATSPAYKWG